MISRFSLTRGIYYAKYYAPRGLRGMAACGMKNDGMEKKKMISENSNINASKTRKLLILTSADGINIYVPALFITNSFLLNLYPDTLKKKRADQIP